MQAEQPVSAAQPCRRRGRSSEEAEARRAGEQMETVQQGARSLVSAVSRTLGVGVAPPRRGTGRSPSPRTSPARLPRGRTEESAAEKTKNAQDTRRSSPRPVWPCPER